MNPCFASPFGDAGYDVSDYYLASSRYRTNEDLKRLFEEVHKRSMHILLDLIPGHTSTEHKWFKESMKAEKNEYVMSGQILFGLSLTVWLARNFRQRGFLRCKLFFSSACFELWLLQTGSCKKMANGRTRP